VLRVLLPLRISHIKYRHRFSRRSSTCTPPSNDAMQSVGSGSGAGGGGAYLAMASCSVRYHCANRRSQGARRHVARLMRQNGNSVLFWPNRFVPVIWCRATVYRTWSAPKPATTVLKPVGAG
jgi:hypothetical protein